MREARAVARVRMMPDGRSLPGWRLARAAPRRLAVPVLLHYYRLRDSLG